MEDDSVETPAAGGTTVTGRWNPTKEQIRMLEGLYGQGMRTPSTEQIQEITKRLKAYGHIEGKNVFYWFQNHKARQRQKQKQDHMVNYFNGYLHNANSPLFPPPHPSPNVVCNPYYIPQRDQLGFRPNHPNLLAPGGIKKGASPQKVSPVYEPVGSGSCVMRHKGDNSEELNHYQETLLLFPLHPTGILQERSITSNSSLSSSLTTSAENSTTTTPSSSCDTNEQDHTFFDFF